MIAPRFAVLSSRGVFRAHRKQSLHQRKKRKQRTDQLRPKVPYRLLDRQSLSSVPMQIVRRFWYEPIQSGKAKAVSATDAESCGYIVIKGSETVDKASNPQILIN